MRLHQPMSALDALERFLAEPGVARAVASRHVLPAREPEFAPVPEWLDPRLVRAMEQRGIHSLYSHQREALDALHDGGSAFLGPGGKAPRGQEQTGDDGDDQQPSHGSTPLTS